jgi:hypothetical protein
MLPVKKYRGKERTKGRKAKKPLRVCNVLTPNASTATSSIREMTPSKKNKSMNRLAKRHIAVYYLKRSA